MPDPVRHSLRLCNFTELIHEEAARGWIAMPCRQKTFSFRSKRLNFPAQSGNLLILPHRDFQVMA